MKEKLIKIETESDAEGIFKVFYLFEFQRNQNVHGNIRFESEAKGNCVE